MSEGSVRELAMEALTKVEQQQAYSNLLLNQLLQQHRLRPVDARLLTEIVYGTIQRRNTIDYFLTQFVTRGLHRLKPWVRNLLRLSFYQLYYLDRIPAHAIVNEAVVIAKRMGKGNKGISGLVNGVLRTIMRSKERLVLPENLNPVQHTALAHSHPEWLVAQWFKQFGQALTETICEANNRRPDMSVRVNVLQNDRDDIATQLQAQHMQVNESSLSPSGLIIKDSGQHELRAMFDEGRLSIQDESSMLVAHLVNPKPGMKVLDCCAAPGGKSAHMAELMNDEGEVWANDIHPHKRELIIAQAERLGLKSIRPLLGDARQLDQALDGQTFDRILVDAPCSGLGVIRRKPDVKWQKDEEEIRSLPAIQLAILTAASRLLHQEGVLIYSTCTLTSEENEQVIDAFLTQHPQFTLAAEHMAQAMPGDVSQSLLAPGMLRILPHYYDSDGFFIAALKYGTDST